MKRKILGLLVAVGMMLALAACEPPTRAITYPTADCKDVKLADGRPLPMVAQWDEDHASWECEPQSDPEVDDRNADGVNDIDEERYNRLYKNTGRRYRTDDSPPDPSDDE